jgi:tetratricopeptide (TPR) repeat protein
MSEREIQKILYGFGGGFFLAGILMIFFGESGVSTIIFGFTVLLIGMASVGPSTIKTWGAKWGGGGGHIGFDRYKPTEKERELAIRLAQEKPSPEINKEGEKFIEKAEERTPEQRSPEDYLALATEKWRAKDYDAALTNVFAGLALNPENIRIQATLILRKGTIYEDLGLEDQAIQYYKEAMELDPKFAWPHNNLGNVFDDQGKHEKAEFEYKKAIELDPKDADPHNGLGNVYETQGKQEEAESEYKKSIELDPKDAYPHNGLGCLYSGQGKLKAAKEKYEKALQLEPDFALAKENLEKLNKEMKKGE